MEKEESKGGGRVLGSDHTLSPAAAMEMRRRNPQRRGKGEEVLIAKQPFSPQSVACKEWTGEGGEERREKKKRRGRKLPPSSVCWVPPEENLQGEKRSWGEKTGLHVLSSFCDGG